MTPGLTLTEMRKYNSYRKKSKLPQCLTTVVYNSVDVVGGERARSEIDGDFMGHVGNEDIAENETLR